MFAMGDDLSRSTSRFVEIRLTVKDSSSTLQTAEIHTVFGVPLNSFHWCDVLFRRKDTDLMLYSLMLFVTLAQF